jgi:hypothetical protein
MQREFLWSLPVKNTSDKTIDITDIETSCGCGSVKPTSVAIAPGEVAEFHLRLDLTPKGADNRSKTVWPFSTRLVPILRNGGAGELLWTIRGTVRKAFDLSSELVDFGDSLVCGSAFAPKSILVRCILPHSGLSARCEDSVASVRVLPAREKAWGYEVEVLPKRDLPVGDHKFAVVLEAVPPVDVRSSAARVELPNFRVEVRARVHPRIRALPEEVFLGAAYVGESLDDMVTLSSVDIPFRVVNVECNPEGSLVVSRAKSSKDGETRQTYQVLQRVTDVGIQEGKIRFFIAPSTPTEQVTLTVSVTYQGLGGRSED